MALEFLAIIGSDNGLSPFSVPNQYLNQWWLNCLLDPQDHMWIKFFSKFKHFTKKMDLNMSSSKCNPFCPGPTLLIVISDFPFHQVGQAPACRDLAPCRLCSATSTTSATMPAAMTNLTGSPRVLQFPWCPCPTPRSFHSSVVAQCVRHQPTWSRCTVKRRRCRIVQGVGTGSGLDTVLLWWEKCRIICVE